MILKPPFGVPLSPKPVSPIALEYVEIVAESLRRVSAGHYAFALVTEVQGGVRIEVGDLDGPDHDGSLATVSLSEQLNSDGSVRVPMYTGATFVSTFTLLPEAALEHHEYMNWRFGEIVFTSVNGTALEITPGKDFNLSVWVAHYPYDSTRATQFTSSSSVLDSVWHLNQNSVRYDGLTPRGSMWEQSFPRLLRTGGKGSISA